jgi:hypothetical protein
MAEHTRSRETSAAPDAVWRIWSDPSTWPDWNPDIQTVDLHGPFTTGATGTMTTRSGGRHDISLASVDAPRSFELATAPVPGARFQFRCEVAPAGSGSRIAQSLTMHGPMAWLYSPMMGGSIAKSFDPILDGLAKRAESEATRQPIA